MIEPRVTSTFTGEGKGGNRKEKGNGAVQQPGKEDLKEYHRS